MTKQTITLKSGNQIAYWTHNDDKKPTIILVHGFTGSHLGFQYLVPLLRDFRLITPDVPGFGVSPLPHQATTLEHLGALLNEFIDALGLEKPHLLGHSMGSLVVAEALRQRPGIAAKKLIFTSPVPAQVGIFELRRPGVIGSKAYYIASHRLPVVGKRLATSKSLHRISTDLIMTTKDKELRKAIHGHHANNLNYISSRGWYSRIYSEINKTGLSKYQSVLEKFDVLIINGNRDTVTPLKLQKRVAQAIGGRVAIVSDTGHLAHYEKPVEIATEIREFLR